MNDVHDISRDIHVKLGHRGQIRMANELQKKYNNW